MKWQHTSSDFAHALLYLVQLVEGAQAKATYGLTLNYKPLEALVDRLLRDTTLSGEQVAEVLDGAGVIPFPDPFVEGFKWDEEGRLVYPGMEEEVCTAGFWEHLHACRARHCHQDCVCYLSLGIYELSFVCCTFTSW